MNLENKFKNILKELKECSQYHTFKKFASSRFVNVDINLLEKTVNSLKKEEKENIIKSYILLFNYGIWIGLFW